MQIKLKTTALLNGEMWTHWCDVKIMNTFNWICISVTFKKGSLQTSIKFPANQNHMVAIQTCTHKLVTLSVISCFIFFFLLYLLSGIKLDVYCFERFKSTLNMVIIWHYETTCFNHSYYVSFKMGMQYCYRTSLIAKTCGSNTLEGKDLFE